MYSARSFYGDNNIEKIPGGIDERGKKVKEKCRHVVVTAAD